LFYKFLALRCARVGLSVCRAQQPGWAATSYWGTRNRWPPIPTTVQTWGAHGLNKSSCGSDFVQRELRHSDTMPTCGG